MAERLAEELDRLCRFPCWKREDLVVFETYFREIFWMGLQHTSVADYSNATSRGTQIAYINFESFLHIAKVDGIATFVDL